MRRMTRSLAHAGVLSMVLAGSVGCDAAADDPQIVDGEEIGESTDELGVEFLTDRECADFDTGDGLRRLSICTRGWISEGGRQTRGVVEMHTYALVGDRYDGAMLVDPRAGAVLDVQPVGRELVGLLVAVGDRRGVTPMVFGRLGGREVLLHRPAANEAQAHFLRDRQGERRLTETGDLTGSDDVLLVSFLGRSAELAPIRADVAALQSDALSTRFAEDVYHPPFCAFDVLAREADKGRALRRLAERLHVQPEAITVFGDHLNDLSMFEASGTRIAVANAHPSVRAAADRVIASNDDDGVAAYLEDWFARKAW